MQIEITLSAPPGAGYPARDLGFLLHKHPDHVHERDTAAGKVRIFFPEVGDERSTAVLHLDIDTVGLVRGRNRQSDGLLTQYVNDRPYVANSFLSVAISRALGQSLAGKSRDRQELADRPLPFSARIVPVAAAGGTEVMAELFAPLGYEISTTLLADEGNRALYDMTLSAEIRLQDLLKHLYVLVPVLDNAKHYWIDKDEIDKLLDKGEGWLKDHPAQKLIARRALKNRRALANIALARLAEDAEPEEDPETRAAKETAEEILEKPIRLHDLRLDSVVEVLKANDAASVLDLGCGEGKLLRRLVKERSIARIVGVDPSVRAIEIAAGRLKLDRAGSALSNRLTLQMGSLTYADRRWQGFDAATLVEVIEHIDPPRLPMLELSLFSDAAPRLVIVTTPNREYKALFDGMPEGALRHPDHRFEWSRAEFSEWAGRVAEEHGYEFEILPLGPVDEDHGAPSQMALFRQGAAT
ncbi:MAG: 3' terminal RNA ribose 2'-O-methyltransferase Hen1 [Pseudomonadota bacterium]